ncbi:hypothetical protein GQ457_06G000990 [Hibiscus cannabinus]
MVKWTVSLIMEGTLDGNRCRSPDLFLAISLTFCIQILLEWLGAMLEFGYGCYVRDQAGTSDGNYQLFAGSNMIWNNAMWLQTFPGSMEFECKGCVSGQFGGCSKVQEGGVVSFSG